VLNQQHNIMICPAEPTFLDTNSLGEKKPENPIKFKKILTKKKIKLTN